MGNLKSNVCFSVLNTHINAHCIIVVVEAHKEDSGGLQSLIVFLCIIDLNSCNIFTNYMNTVRNIKTHARAHMRTHTPDNSLVKLDEHFMQSR